ncbi:MAG TPA: ABC-three component system protein [Beijerinckiaceae bacterium]|nr:ABC-three component system protein [Beijerinckiaceae bacterium]
MKKTKNDKSASETEHLKAPTPWPGANARLLGLGQGLPVAPLDRLANFSAADFERFTLEWASDYLAVKVPGIIEVQQRGGAGDKGRDVIAWLDPNTVPNRRWRLYQCKHYASALGAGPAVAEIGKVLFYSHRGDYSFPQEYHFITHKGVTSPFQDLLDEPEKLRKFVIDNWDKYIRTEVRNEPVDLTPELKIHVETVPFTVFRAKQPLDLINEHGQTRYHLTVFGLPLIERPKPPEPPSEVAPGEIEYVTQLLAVISADLGQPVSQLTDFVHSEKHRRLFDRSRLTFYHAEGLKELARDQMADEGFFNTLLGEFVDGLYHWHTGEPEGYDRLISTIKASQVLQLSKHVLEPHVLPNDREGMCHQMANEGRVHWCET